MNRFSNETQQIIDKYIDKAIEHKDRYNDLKLVMEDFASEIISITCKRMIDPD